MKALHTIHYRLNPHSGLYSGHAAGHWGYIGEEKPRPAYLDIPADSGPKAATIGYSEDHEASDELNLVLRLGNPDSEALKRRDLINEYLASLPPDPTLKGERLYRRIRLTPEGVSAACKRYRPSRIVTEEQFTSTSRGGVHPDFMDRNVEFVIISPSGRSIADIAKYPDQREVLIPAGTRFEVKEARLNPEPGLDLLIQLEEVK